MGTVLKSVTPLTKRLSTSKKRLGAKRRTKEDVDSVIEQQLNTKYVVTKGCWVWKGLYFGNGYGRLSRHLNISKYSYRAHIASYQLHKGPIPAGLFVCHTCDVRGCINPDHLWLGTNQQNQLDAVAKGVFDRYWTPEKRAAKSMLNSGAGNPMYGRTGKDAPTYGRTGEKHPMFGKHHKEESKAKISASLKLTFDKRSK